MTEALVVQAIYSFKGTNNDELCFKKGEIITVTQKEDGGWWEGTLGGKTGWFPSNYVVECKDVPVVSPITPISQQKQYQEVVIKDLVDSEKAHVAELQGLITNFLVPLEKSSILTLDEFKQLTSNLSEVVETHQQLLNSLEDNIKVIHGARIGNLFLTRAPKIKAVHQTYCSLHPRAVCILDKYKDELTKFMESCNAASPGVLVLTTGLSKPFRRLDKYSGMLQELERHLEESHPDRGDTQRSVVVYKEIAATCAATRRQKELELQVLTGPVRGWEGQSLVTLGDIIYMGSVAIGPQHHDRYLVLFPTTLLMLSISHRLSAFIYEGKLPLTGIVVNRLEDSDQFKNAFEISGPMIEKKIAVCQSKDEANHWVELLRKHMPRSSNTHQKVSPSQAEIVSQPHLNQRGYCSRTSVVSYSPLVNYVTTLPPPNYPPASPYNALARLYHKCVKQKIINRKLLKSLLYPEYLVKIDTSKVKRRHHKVECVIIKRDSNCRDSIIKCDSDSDSDSSSLDEDTNKIYRQDAIDRNSSSDNDSDSSDDNNPFGYIRYYNPSTGEKREETKYESVIDYGIVTTPKLVRRQSTKPSIILTSTAKVKLVKQFSENSEASSSNFVPKCSMACEDLVNLDSSFEMDTLDIPESYVPTSRQSCPTKMVGNKFSKSSLTTIYIPTWQSSSDNNLCAQKFSTDKKVALASTTASSSESSTTHSSSIDIPVNIAPLPDAMLAELLYNYNKEEDQKIVEKADSLESDKTEFSSQTVIKPPPMFQNGNRLLSQSNEELNSPGSELFNLDFKNIKFKKHSINSDKPKRKSSIHINTTADSNLRRCVSYKYLELEKKDTSIPVRASYCRCCPEACHSPRSSDSGMAGSCTLNSPDLTPNELYTTQERSSTDMSMLYQKYNDLARLTADSRNILSLSEIEARTYESQCQCTSPFGSTPRTSCQASTSENVYSGSQQDSARTSVTSSLDLYPYPIPQPWEAENQIHSKILSIRPNIPIPKKNTFRQLPQKSKSLTNVPLLGRSPMTTVGEEEEEGKKETFKSGLYAHWWMKAKIPPEVIKGIYQDTRLAATGKGGHVWRTLFSFLAFLCLEINITLA
ncbi:RhoGEF domain [Popillia japonica]|uniref:RhoGEF domain n=1 Tax=Popillia japonica TaxID=7064 RepID=A0AAW1LUX5_POPJA